MGLNQEKWFELVTSTVARVEYEHQFLSIGREFLPPEAKRVLDGTSDELSESAKESYYGWLVEQYLEM